MSWFEKYIGVIDAQLIILLLIALIVESIELINLNHSPTLNKMLLAIWVINIILWFNIGVTRYLTIKRKDSVDEAPEHRQERQD